LRRIGCLGLVGPPQPTSKIQATCAPTPTSIQECGVAGLVLPSLDGSGVVMKITAIREATVSDHTKTHNASIGFSSMTASALVVETDRFRNGTPLCGLAFDSVGRYGHGALLRERFIPRLLAAQPDHYLDETGENIDPAKVWTILMRDEKAGGHGERAGAVGLLDAAIWDLVAKITGRPLWAELGRRFGGAISAPRVPIYATCGFYNENNDISALKAELSRVLALGYDCVKIKAGGQSIPGDCRRIEAALAALDGKAALALDCNGAMDLPAARAFFSALSGYPLAWIEEPVDPLDFESLGHLAAEFPVAIGTGENLFSAADTRNLLLYGGLRPDRDLLQIDVSLSYGIVEYLRVVELIEARGWNRRQCAPHAGHLLSMHVVAGLGLGRHETAPFGRYVHGLPVESGHVLAGERPGVGFEDTPKMLAAFSSLLTGS
jgi:D(-)-tartrate dehydratase